ncbi:MAG: YlxR family protein [Clostridia bacterium]|nr:YlxR family protein [Clostridia bacterium]
MKNIPQRTCSVCRTQKNKSDLLRIVKNKENIIKVDEMGKEPGRGAYICYDVQCLEKAQKTKKLEKVLEIKLENELYEQMKNIIEKKNGGDVIG